MAFEFKLPDIGEGVVEGEIVKWLVKPGDRIEVDQPMVEIMTDKATVVIPSPRAGTVMETRGKEGEIAKVHSTLVVIDEQGGAGKAAKPQEPAAKPAPAPQTQAPQAARPAQAQPAQAAQPAARPPQAPPARAAAPQTQAQAQPRPQAARPPQAPPATARGRPAQGGDGSNARREGATNGHPAPAQAERAEAEAAAGGKVLAAPATRRLARELGIELAMIRGSGPAGRVTSEDVRRAAEASTSQGEQAAQTVEMPVPHIEEAPAPHARETEARLPARPQQAPAGAQDERIPVRGLRKRIWENMVQSSFTAAHFTFVEECDVTELVKLRDRFNARLREGEEKLSYLPFIVKAVIAALKRFPDINAHVDDDNMEYIRRADYHIGIATASERGLIVPVVRHADRRSILELAQEIKRLADAVRATKVQAQDLGGSTFTITSLGKDGGIFATPIINYPEVAIMGVHKISKRPMVRDDQIVIRDMMNLSLSFDHRLIDGHVGAAFVYAVIRLLEDPERLLMEMQ